MDQFVRGLPKAELHVHIEGTLEPEMMFEMAARNGVALPFASVEATRAAYEFDDLQSFLDLYYLGAAALVTESDFADLMSAYLDRAIADGVRHAEIFFDPQTHTERGVDIGTVIKGFARARGAKADQISTMLIMCFLRHLPPESAVETLLTAMPYRDHIVAVGLDSSEAGIPPDLFAEPYRMAKEAGFRVVAHAGEEGPPAYIWAALDVLGAERIDHGVTADQDPALVDRLVAEQIPLTMCPLSNQRLHVFPDLAAHNLKRFLGRGVRVTINSDDPAYFGGYIADNYAAAAKALNLDEDELAQIARNSITASFLPQDRKTQLLAAIDEFAG
ncbi:MAG: adenosine deaminase [Acidimicrobiia bacterium]|nr:adenosine deaminase [Acidimicrobiia bacterium]